MALASSIVETWKDELNEAHIDIGLILTTFLLSNKLLLSFSLKTIFLDTVFTDSSGVM